MSESRLAIPGLKDVAGGAELTVRVQPGASRNDLSVTGGQVRLRVTAPPVEGRANEKAVEALAAFLGLRNSQVELARGTASRTKVIRIRGITACDLERRLVRFLKDESGS
ncbi:MAG: DUF167 domain-containing protein [Firmicutes bacterium]|nr:DUF167 domain-containing protein [Bacillota bacterium]